MDRTTSGESGATGAASAEGSKVVTPTVSAISTAWWATRALPDSVTIVGAGMPFSFTASARAYTTSSAYSCRE